MCYACMALVGQFRLPHIRLRSVLHILLALQVGILFWFANPFIDPLPKFFNEVGPWFTLHLSIGLQFSFFMRLCPPLVFFCPAAALLGPPPGRGGCAVKRQTVLAAAVHHLQLPVEILGQ